MPKTIHLQGKEAEDYLDSLENGATPDRLISETWAIIREDGKIAGDGECKLDGFCSREDAEEDLKRCRDYYERINGCTAFRVSKVRLTEIAE